MSESAPHTVSRRVNWLELIFDLVMVACIGQIAHTMHGDPGPLEFLGFFGLLAVVWWAWVNASVTMNLFGARVTAMNWVAVTIAMIAIAFMAAAVPEAFGERASGFAVANALIRAVWMVPWLANRRVAGIPWWRPVLYSLVPAALWLASIAIAAPARYVLWAVAIVVEAWPPSSGSSPSSCSRGSSSPTRRPPSSQDSTGSSGGGVWRVCATR